MAKQRTIVGRCDLFKELEAAAGDNKQLRDKFRRMRKEFGNKDFASNFTAAQKAEILALAERSVGNWRELRRLMGTAAGEARGPRPIPEGEASHMGKAEKERIKKVLDAAVLKPDDLLAHALFGAHDFHDFHGRRGLTHSVGRGTYDSTSAGRAIMGARVARISAIPYEKRGVCYMELGQNRSAADAFVLAAAQIEKEEPARGSLLREQAGDLFCRCREEDCGPIVSPAWSGTSSPGFHAPLPEREDPIAGRTMYEEAIREYLLATNLVKKTDPDRAAGLESKMGVAQSKLHDEEDGISRDD